jgi:uncharacterized membrane protein (DUF2068 family)
MAAPTHLVAPKPQRAHGDVGVSVIVAYKLGKAALQIVAAVVLVMALRTGAAERLREIVLRQIEHGTSHLAFRIAHVIGQFTTAREVRVVALALSLDGLLSLVEGLALHRRYRWAPWLIVVATSVAVPFEIVSLLRQMRPVRLIVLVVNLVLVAYLVRRAQGERS